MNAKIDSLKREIDKTKGKIMDLQQRLDDLEKRKTKLENEEYATGCRSLNLTPQEIAEIVKVYKKDPGIIDRLLAAREQMEEQREESDEKKEN